MGAPDKDSVYAALRERGIRAIKVAERIQPVVRKGFKGLRKRDVLCLVLCALCIAGVVWFFATRKARRATPVNRTIEQSQQSNNRLSPLPRHQIAGFANIDFAAVFANPSEAYLVRYAQPGVVIPKGKPPLNLAEDLIDNLKTPMPIVEGEETSVTELRRTVLGVKNEIALLLTSGRGLDDVLGWLEERQRMEAAHRSKIIGNFKRGVTTKETANRILRTMGLERIE